MKLVPACFLWIVLLSGLKGQDAPIQHIPVTVFNYGEKILIQASSSAALEGMKIYFRYEGISQFQVRNMEPLEGDIFEFELDSGQFPGLFFEYYLEVRVDGENVRLPSGAPEESFSAEGASEESLPEIPAEIDLEEATRKVLFKANVNGSIQNNILGNESGDGQNDFQASGNVQIISNYNRNSLGADLDINHAYTNSPIPGENNLDLSNMMLTVGLNSHTFRAGDLNIYESEFSVSGLGRRGVEYSYDNQRTYLHIFDVNSQQPRGYDGFGIPKSGINIMGGALGYTLFNSRLKLKAVYLTGKDDPSLGVNVGVDSFYQARKGNVLAFVQEASLLNNQLSLSSEFAASQYDGNLDDDERSVSDTAWRMGGQYNWRGLSASANYRYIGKDFNPIGYQYYTNNRKSMDANLGLSLKAVNINGTYVYEKDNVEEDPSEYQTSNQSANLNFMWSVNEKLSVNFALSRGKQNTTGGSGVFLFMQDSLSHQVSGNINYIIGQTANFNLSVVNVFQSSDQNPQNDMRNLTLNLGGSVRIGQRVSLMPSLGYAEMENRFTKEKQHTYNSFLTAEISFIPQVFTSSLSGSYTRNDMGPGTISTNFTVSGNLNLYTQSFIHFGNFILSLRGNYTHMKMPGFKNSYHSIQLQMDFLF